VCRGVARRDGLRAATLWEDAASSTAGGLERGDQRKWSGGGGKTKGKRPCLPSKSNTSTSPWRLVHLTKYQRDLGLAIELDDGGFLHFVVQIVTLTGSLTDTGEDGETTMGLGDVVLESISKCNACC
jgi:hypothetical protein